MKIKIPKEQVKGLVEVVAVVRVGVLPDVRKKTQKKTSFTNDDLVNMEERKLRMIYGSHAKPL